LSCKCQAVFGNWKKRHVHIFSHMVYLANGMLAYVRQAKAWKAPVPWGLFSPALLESSHHVLDDKNHMIQSPLCPGWQSSNCYICEKDFLGYPAIIWLTADCRHMRKSQRIQLSWYKSEESTNSQNHDTKTLSHNNKMQ
jgi:hypothetical protein